MEVHHEIVVSFGLTELRDRAGYGRPGLISKSPVETNDEGCACDRGGFEEEERPVRE